MVDTNLILIHHIGAKSKIGRVTPLAYARLGDGRLVIVASNGRSPTSPDWLHNLKANPTITVEVGSRTLTVLAEQLRDAARAELWPN
jgi:deazaflavin-dependent oxidoreductase (nitroreductase family)